MSEPAFDRVGEQFVGYYNTVRGYVRQEVARLNLQPFLSDPTMKIADIGGGDGRDAYWLAEQGHDVVLVDPAHKMLLAARKYGADHGTTLGRVALVEGNDTTLVTRGEVGQFDMVLSHGVVMYDLRDPAGHIIRLSTLLKPGGYLSLLNKGFHGTVERLQASGDSAELEHLRRTHQVTKNGLDEPAWAFDEVETQTMLEDAGLKVVKWAGVRIEQDANRAPVNQVDPAELQTIIAREYELSNNPSTRHRGQMLHFIAQKPV